MTTDRPSHGQLVNDFLQMHGRPFQQRVQPCSSLARRECDGTQTSSSIHHPTQPPASPPAMMTLSQSRVSGCGSDEKEPHQTECSFKFQACTKANLGDIWLSLDFRFAPGR